MGRMRQVYSAFKSMITPFWTSSPLRFEWRACSCRIEMPGPERHNTYQLTMNHWQEFRKDPNNHHHTQKLRTIPGRTNKTLKYRIGSSLKLIITDNHPSCHLGG